MNQSEQINEIAGALAKAQGDIKGAAKDSTNPHFKSKYADLASVWDACRQALSKNGLSVIQTPDTTADGVFLYTTLAHSSGQWIRGVMPVRPVQDTPQGLGSAMTYARRYSLASMVGVAPDDDDDGNAATANDGTGRAYTTRTAAPKPAESPEVVKSREAFTRIKEAINLSKTAADIDKVIELQGKTLAEIKEVSQTGYEQLMAFAEERKGNMLRQAA